MKLLDFAKLHGAELLPPISEDQIRKFETDHGLKIPPVLRAFYLEAGGTNEFTQWGWRIWPFDELTTIESKAGKTPDIECLNGYDRCPPLSDYLAFIDVMIVAPLYAVCSNSANPRFGEVISVAGDNSLFLGGPIQTFEDFETILCDHWGDIVLPNTTNSEQVGGGNSASLRASP